MMQSREEAQGRCLQQKQAVGEAQARASQLSLQVESLQRRVEELQQVLGRGCWPGRRAEASMCCHLTVCPMHQDLSSKEQEKVAEVNRVRVELQEQVGRLQAEQTAQEGLREKIAALERQMKGDGGAGQCDECTLSQG